MADVKAEQTVEPRANGPAAGYVVDRVVICDAYREPHQFYKLNPGSKAKLEGGRRPSMRFLASAKVTKGGIAGVAGKQQALIAEATEVNEELNDFVNSLRAEVTAWREGGYGNTARVTRSLLEWWFERDEERRFQGKRFFFCQQEAIETLIYLYEVKGKQKMPGTDDLLRYALKLATGTGKTVVMALIIVWSSLHRRKVSGSNLSSNFLIMVPNLTVRDRVWGTDPLTKVATGSGLDFRSVENLYDEFDMLPPEYATEFEPQVQVKNWQSIPLEASRDDWIKESDLTGDQRFMPASVLRRLQRRQQADPRKAIRKALEGWRDLIIINDEAHHVYGEKRTKKDEDPQHIKWSKIIKGIKEAVKLPLVIDLSATPWYGSGSPKPEGTLFEWLVSDFSVYDAFESGLVKVVRLPESEDKEHKYLDMWDMVKGAKTKEEYIAASRGAIQSIWGSWKEDYKEWLAWSLTLSLDGGVHNPPPVLLVVADTAQRAKWLYEHLTSGSYEYMENPISDDPFEWHTIQVDSKVFEADKGQALKLREMVNTVGKKGKAGEDVHCIVSVNMLSEGWDVKNVSHILGLRAFGSPLLTEQIIGRGLRRMDYSPLNLPLEERLQNPNRADEETVDAFGIPFVGFPVEKRKRPKVKGWTGKSVPIAPDAKKQKYRIEVPNIRSWAVGVSKPLVETIPMKSLAPLVIDPKETPPEVTVKSVVGDSSETITLDQWREDFPLSRSKFELAAELHALVSAEQDGVLTGPTFDEVFEFVEHYLAECVSVKGASKLQDVAIPYWRNQVTDALQTAIQDAPTDMVTVPIAGHPPTLSTDVREFKWPAITHKGKKTHWNEVPCHVDLEREFAAFLDEAPDVVRYVKNERFGFSLTYYEGGRPRQYYPDFIVAVTEDGREVWWLAEPKGEIRPNTKIKEEAARLWCDRMTRAGKGSWNYLFVHQPCWNKAKKSARTFADLAEALEQLPTATPHLMLISVDDPRVERAAFKTLLPVYSLEAAAGYFVEGKAVELEGWAEAPGFKNLTDDMFVARAVGKSMEPTIQDGDYLVFKANPAGTRQGKVVLAVGDILDPELGGGYTVKRYRRVEALNDEEDRTASIQLVPDNAEFKPIEVESGSEVRVVAEFIGKLFPE